jgi:hypothetical protein
VPTCKRGGAHQAQASIHLAQRVTANAPGFTVCRCALIFSVPPDLIAAQLWTLRDFCWFGETPPPRFLYIPIEGSFMRAAART